MKSFRRLICTLLVACFFCAGLAVAEVPATPNQKLSFRTGPNTKYLEMFTVSQNTEITAIEYEEGNDVTWVLVEFMHKGQRMQGYTGLKRMTVHGEIPWASHLYETAEAICQADIWAAPARDAAVRGLMEAGDEVSVLRFEDGYAFIEYMDEASGEPSRGWVEDWTLDTAPEFEFEEAPQSVLMEIGSVSMPMRTVTPVTLLARPSYDAFGIMTLAAGATVYCYGDLYCGYSIVEVGGVMGYIPTSCLVHFE